MTTKTLKLMLAVLSVLVAPFGYCAPPAPAHTTAAGTGNSKSHVLSKAELDALLAQPDKVLIIDVRRPDEVSEIGGLPVYLSIQVGDLEKRLAWIPKDRTLVTLSNHAARATRAADLLLSHGFTVAGAAGAQTYEQQGGTLTKVAKPTPTASAGAAH